MKIFLIGYMGSGKSTFGPKLASVLNVPFMDLDHLIETHVGLTIPQYFEHHGEAAFRNVEAELLRNITEQKASFLLSTGGGAPVFHDNMEFMNKNGITIYLEMEPQALAERLAPVKAVRPLLRNVSDEDLPNFIASKLQEREGCYKKAHLITSGLNPDAEAIASQLLNPLQ